MYTIKIYASQCTFIIPCNNLRVLHQDNQSFIDRQNEVYVNYEKEKVPHDNDLFAIIAYDDNSKTGHGEWLLHGPDRAYIVNENGKTIEQIRYQKPLEG
jgi:hypothetical protein